MRVSGERLKRTRLVQTTKYVIAVDVELAVPIDDPSVPCYESETAALLKEVERRAKSGDLAWLREHGKVYAAVGVS